jgi:hypothetical protein
MMPAKKIIEEPNVDDVSNAPVSEFWNMLTPSDFKDWPEFREYFYDGEVCARYGKVEVPRSRPEWAQRMLYLGYTWDGETPEDFSYVGD